MQINHRKEYFGQYFHSARALIQHPTEVGSAPLFHFQKRFRHKVFYVLKLVTKFKFYTWIIISGSKRGEKGKKNDEKTHKFGL